MYSIDFKNPAKKMCEHKNINIIDPFLSIVSPFCASKQALAFCKRVYHRPGGVDEERLPCMREIGVRSSIGRDKRKSLKHVVSTPLPDARQQVLSVTGPRR